MERSCYICIFFKPESENKQIGICLDPPFAIFGAEKIENSEGSTCENWDGFQTLTKYLRGDSMPIGNASVLTDRTDEI